MKGIACLVLLHCGIFDPSMTASGRSRLIDLLATPLRCPLCPKSGDPIANRAGAVRVGSTLIRLARIPPSASPDRPAIRRACSRLMSSTSSSAVMRLSPSNSRGVRSDPRTRRCRRWIKTQSPFKAACPFLPGADISRTRWLRLVAFYSQMAKRRAGCAMPSTELFRGRIFGVQ